jgi:transcriptional regulator with XRE-family HTH domain
MSILSDNLKKARKDLNVSQEKAAVLLKIPRSRLGSYEEGRAEPPIILLPRLVDVYGIGDWPSFLTSPNWKPGTHAIPRRLSVIEERYHQLDEMHKALVDKLLKLD